MWKIKDYLCFIKLSCMHALVFQLGSLLIFCIIKNVRTQKIHKSIIL